MDNKNTTTDQTAPAQPVTTPAAPAQNETTTPAPAPAAAPAPTAPAPEPAAKTADANPPSLFRSDSDTAQVSAGSTASGSSDIFAQFAERIIKEQEGIIGPIAYEQASKVSGIAIDPTNHSVKLNGDKKRILENLVKQYELLFGRVSIEICKEAVRGVIGNAPSDQIPQILL